MKQSHRLDPLLRRAQDHEDEVARTLAERQQSLDMHQSRLEELRRYVDEYANQQMASAQMAATSPSQLMNRRAFLDRLDSAVQQQSQTVDRNRERVDAERARLLLMPGSHDEYADLERHLDTLTGFLDGAMGPR